MIFSISSLKSKLPAEDAKEKKSTMDTYWYRVSTTSARTDVGIRGIHRDYQIESDFKAK